MKRLIPDRKCMLAILVVLCFGLMTPAAQAFSVDYQFGGTGVYGDVGGEQFKNANFLISIIGDTQDVFDDTFGPVITQLPGTIYIYGGEFNTQINASFSELLYVFVDPFSDLVGFGSNITADLMTIYYPDVWQYNLRSLYGPIFAGSGFVGTWYNYLTGAETSLGVLTVDTLNTGSFQAAQPVPVPASVLLLASGLAGLIVIRRRPKS